jgi:hypothetical protein
MITDSITAVANLLGSVVGIGKTLLDKYDAKEYDDAFSRSMVELQKEVQKVELYGDTLDLHQHVISVLDTNGYPTIEEPMGCTVRVPLASLANLIAIAEASNRDKGKINQLIQILTGLSNK